MSTPRWKGLLDHVQAVPERIYEHWNSSAGWDNVTQFGAEYGENGVSWCVIFDWDMYHDVGLDSIVPKTDNVGAFSSWAQRHGQWSEYPSVGSWVNFGNGSHTEIVTGFDQTNVYTKGGNSIQAGAADNGQGNGVFSHAHPRHDPYVTGYFAPHFPDGVCPPTADPSDPRGGRAVSSYRWSPDPSTGAPSVSLAHVVQAAHEDPPAPDGHMTYRADVLPVEQALSAEGLLDHQYVDGSYGTKTLTAYAAWQRESGFSGSDADGVPGMLTLRMLGARHGFMVTA